MDDLIRMLLGLFFGIVVMIILVSKIRIHTFIALLVAACITGMVGGMPLVDITTKDASVIIGLTTAIKDGFGNTLRSTGIIIGLGVILGGALEKSGAAEQLAYSFIKAVGRNKEEWALAITGWIVSIPVFADSAIIILAPLAKAISKATRKSIIGLALAMAAGLQLTHCLVPPTPGPMTAAEMLNVDIGQMIISGALISIPMLVVAVIYSKYIGKKIYHIPEYDGEFDIKKFKSEYIKTIEEIDDLNHKEALPGLGVSVVPIVMPLVLILVQTVLTMMEISNDIIMFFGDPIIALCIGTWMAIYVLMRKEGKNIVKNVMDDAIKHAGSIILITGAGGALGNVVKVSGMGTILGEFIAGLPLPAILIPFIIAALMRIVLGSATVAITTAASLSAPFFAVIQVNPLLMAISCCIGSISFSYFNDSGFWLWNEMFGVTEMKNQLRCKTAVSMIMSLVGILELIILDIVIC